MAVSGIVVRSTLAALATLLGCSAASTEESHQPSPVIRIAAGPELFAEGLEPSEWRTNTISYVYDLLYKDASDELSIVDRTGASVTLERRAESRWKVEELAGSLRFVGLIGAKVMPNGQIRAMFSSEDRAIAFAESNEAGLATGDYEPVVSENVIRLQPADQNRPALELVPTSNDDAWRLLAGRQLDVVPDIGPLNADHLRDIDSIAVHEMKTETFIGLAFNLHSKTATDVSLRRAIAAAVKSSAVVDLVCGSGCKMQLPGLGDDANAEAAPTIDWPRLSLLVAGMQAENVIAGHVLAHAVWAQTGVRPRLEALPLDQLADRLREGTFDAMLLPCPTAAGPLYERFLPSGSFSVLGYKSADFATAVERHDWARAAAAIQRDAVLVPLWRWRRYAAVDKSICGARPTKPTSWNWLADLHHCREGEKPQ